MSLRSSNRQIQCNHEQRYNANGRRKNFEQLFSPFGDCTRLKWSHAVTTVGHCLWSELNATGQYVISECSTFFNFQNRKRLQDYQENSIYLFRGHITPDDVSLETLSLSDHTLRFDQHSLVFIPCYNSRHTAIAMTLIIYFITTTAQRPSLIKSMATRTLSILQHSLW